MIRWFLTRDGAEHFASCRSDVFRSGERPLHRDSLCEHKTLPCGHIHFSGLPLMCVVKECPELLFVCVRLCGVYTFGRGLPSGRDGSLAQLVCVTIVGRCGLVGAGAVRVGLSVPVGQGGTFE